MEKLNEKNNTVKPINSDLISSLVLQGDISKMNDSMKVEYYNQLCHSLNLNPVTRPFQIITFQGKSILYATKDATEQLRKLNGVSVVELVQDFKNDLCISKCKVQDAAGRYDVATGVVNITGLKGDALANAIMKSETKSKRRATLSICGLGMLDESELDTMPKYETSDITNIKTDTDFADKVINYLKTLKDKTKLQKAYDEAKGRDKYKSLPDEDKARIDEEYLNCIGDAVKTETFDPETEPAVLPKETEVEASFTVEDVLIPNELPEITELKECKTLTDLNKKYKDITTQSVYVQYGDEYKAELKDTYNARLKELRAR